MHGISEALAREISVLGQELPSGSPYVQCGCEGRAWLIRRGRLDLFLARRDAQSGIFVRRHPLLSVCQGEFLFDLMEISAERGQYSPIFVPGPNARCVAFDARKLGGKMSSADARELQDALARYGARLAEGLGETKVLPRSPDWRAGLDAARGAWRETLLARLARFDEGEAFPAAPPLSDFEKECLNRAVSKRAAAEPDFREKFLANPRAAAVYVMGRAFTE